MVILACMKFLFVDNSNNSNICFLFIVFYQDGCDPMCFYEYDCPITTILIAIDLDKFMETLKGAVDHQGSSWTLHIRCLMTFLTFNSMKCIIAVANHINFNAVHPDFGLSPLHLAVWKSCLPLVELFLKHNAPTNFRSPFDIWN